LTSAQIKKIFEASVIKKVVKVMGGYLEVKSTFIETNFILTVPCKNET